MNNTKHIKLNKDKCLCLHLIDDEDDDNDDEDNDVDEKEENYNFKNYHDTRMIRLTLDKCSCQQEQANTEPKISSDLIGNDHKVNLTDNENKIAYENLSKKVKPKNKTSSLPTSSSYSKKENDDFTCKHCAYKEKQISKLNKNNGALKVKLSEINNENVTLKLKLQKYRNYFKSHNNHDSISLMSPTGASQSSIISSPTSSTSTSKDNQQNDNYNTINLKLLKERCAELEEINQHLHEHLTKLKQAFIDLGFDCCNGDNNSEENLTSDCHDDDTVSETSNEKVIINRKINKNSTKQIEANKVKFFTSLSSSSTSSIRSLYHELNSSSNEIPHLSDMQSKSEFEIWLNKK